MLQKENKPLAVLMPIFWHTRTSAWASQSTRIAADNTTARDSLPTFEGHVLSKARRGHTALKWKRERTTGINDHSRKPLLGNLMLMKQMGRAWLSLFCCSNQAFSNSSVYKLYNLCFIFFLSYLNSCLYGSEVEDTKHTVSGHCAAIAPDIEVDGICPTNTEPASIQLQLSHTLILLWKSSISLCDITASELT